MTIKDPCKFCAAAYGHKPECPHPNMFAAVPVDKRDATIEQAQAVWQRGYNDAAKETQIPSEDRVNAVYMLGRQYHELEANGRVPRRKTRPARVPAKSEPRVAAVRT